MMKKIIIPVLLVVLFSCNKNTSKEESTSSEEVYICTGQYAEAYHTTEDCRGIQSCKADIESVTLEEAEEMGRTPCGYCY